MCAPSQVSAAEVNYLVKGLADPTPFYSGGFKLQGVKYQFLRCEPGANVYGRNVRSDPFFS